MGLELKKLKTMRQEDQLIEKYGRDPGFKVPPGYFEELNLKIMTSLPAYPEAPRSVNMSMWQRVKPYVYLAAMFAGIWLMMSVFHRVSDVGTLNLDNPPAAIASAMADQIDDYPMYSVSESDYLLESEVSASYDSMDEFEEDFGYDLKPEYEALEVDVPASLSTHGAESVLI